MSCCCSAPKIKIFNVCCRLYCIDTTHAEMRRQCARAARCASASLAPRSAGPTALRPAHSPAWFAAAPPPCACGRGAGACATCGGRGVARAAAQPPRHGARCACGCAGGRLRGFATQAASPGDAGAGGAGVGPDRVEDSETATVEDLLKELGAKETELEAHAAEARGVACGFGPRAAARENVSLLSLAPPLCLTPLAPD